MILRYPDEPTTPEQWQVIVWGAVVLLAVLGAVGMCYSFRAPADKADLASEVRGYSLACWGLAAAIHVAKRVIAYLFR